MNLSTIGLIVLALISAAFAVCPTDCGCGCHHAPPQLLSPVSTVPAGVEVIRYGEACECGRALPYQVERPKITESPHHTNLGYGYKVEMPPQAPLDVKYSFDFQLEQPKPSDDAEAKLGSYRYEMFRPADVPQDDTKYNFDYQLEVPAAQHYDSPLQSLRSTVDKVLIPNEDCTKKVEGECTCHKYRPTIDIVRSCPKHGHLYRNDNVNNDISFDTVPYAYQQRPKRDLSLQDFTFENELGDSLIGNLDWNPDYVAPTYEEFDEDKDFVAIPMAKHLKEKAEDFLKNLQPKLRTAGTNLKSKFKKFFQQTGCVLNDINDNAEHFLRKRSASPEMYGPQIAAERQVIGSTEHLVHNPNHYAHPCTVCGGGIVLTVPPALQRPLPPQYVELHNGQANGHFGHYEQPSVRYVFDRLGHRYIENNGRFKLIAPSVFESAADAGPMIGSAYDNGHGSANQLQQILEHNSDFIDSTNLYGPEYMVQPPVELVLDTLEFIDDITTLNDGDDHRDESSYDRTMAKRHIEPDALVITVSSPVIRKQQQIIESGPDGSMNFVDPSEKTYELINTENLDASSSIRSDFVRRFLFGSFDGRKRPTQLRLMLSDYLRNNMS